MLGVVTWSLVQELAVSEEVLSLVRARVRGGPLEIGVVDTFVGGFVALGGDVVLQWQNQSSSKR